MKTIKAATICSLLSIVGMLAVCGMANAEHFSFSGYREDTGQSATISFDIEKPTGRITNGTFHLSKVCEPDIHFVGADMTFEGTSSSIALDGNTNYCGGGQSHDCGHGRMWYDSYWGVILQWKSDCQYGVDTNFIFKTSVNPFNH